MTNHTHTGRPSRLPQHDPLIRAMAAAGHSDPEIAAALVAGGHFASLHRATIGAYRKRHGIPPGAPSGAQHGARNAGWRGGRTVDKSGYVLLLRPEHPYANRHGYVREHRLVMEQVLGRYLLPTEVVHHEGVP